MILLLAIIAIQAVVIAWHIKQHREERSRYIDLAASHLRLMFDYDHDVAKLREMVNKERRNTGKAEM